MAGAVGCGEAERPPAPGAGAPSAASSSPGFRGRVHERSFTFTTTDADSAIVVPWLFTNRTRPGGVDRRVRGLLSRGGSWEVFFDDRWETPPTRVPWRLLPMADVRLIVGEGDALETILFERERRSLALEFGDVLVEWTTATGEVLRLTGATARLGDRRVRGIAFDLAREYTADGPPPGDWVFLTSGDSLQVVLESPELAEPGTRGAYRGWGRLDFRDLRWPAVSVAWGEVRAFQPARRDVPVTWVVSSLEGIAGTLTVEAAEVEAGDGSGAVLPVDGVFSVTGTLRIEGGGYPVRGVVRHVRP